ncbi:MAG: HEPN domain-containing protein [Bacteroides sp.]|nr:HEPN domain-containing protein [Bacteroides sp.]MCM1458024.1 HEPN domain-containing protein [Lachnoclostridium sp.]
MSVTEEERNAIIEYRIEKSLSTLTQTKTLYDLGMYGFCANRLYYALFYMLNALMLKNSIFAHTHSGIISMVHKHFIHTGIISTDEGKIIKRTFDLRQGCDYDDFVDADKEDIDMLMPKVELLIDKIRGLIGA